MRAWILQTLLIALWCVASCAAMPREAPCEAGVLGSHADVNISSATTAVIYVGVDSPVRFYDLAPAVAGYTCEIQMSHLGASEGDTWRFNITFGASAGFPERLLLADGEGGAAPWPVQIACESVPVSWFVLMYFDGTKWRVLDAHRIDLP